MSIVALRATCLKILKLWHFSENPQIRGNLITNLFQTKDSPKFMSANADGVRFKFASNVHDWAYFEKVSILGKTEFLLKIGYGLGQDISCFKFLVVSDFKVIFK